MLEVIGLIAIGIIVFTPLDDILIAICVISLTIWFKKRFIK